ncbi:MAG: diguanylate cyclase [Desulfobacterales bacterium]|nr:diguanylate cyclase [Desulfobacterales bacterium]MBF0397627.1 diguanylate cyclase [Desulfobacterales bacterium]
MEKIKVLLIDDDEDEFILTRKLLSKALIFRFELDWVSTYEDAIKTIKEGWHHIYLVDYRLGKDSGIKLLKEALSLGCQKPIIILTGQGDIEVDVQAMESGASDYLNKRHLNSELLERSIRYAIGRKQSELALQIANKNLQEIAIIDPLTNIANRRKFDEYLNQQWKIAQREEKNLSLIMCDIDYFKIYNDTYGHQKGDECLREVAQAINNTINRAYDLAARYGGEEFAVILPNTDIEGALHIGELMLSNVQKLKIPHENSKTERFVTLSLGAATMIPNLSLKPEMLIEASDNRLYKAKQQGRNRIVI